MTDRRNVDVLKGSAVSKRQRSPAVSRAAFAIVQDIERRVDGALYTNFYEAALSPDPDHCNTVLENALSSGTRPEDVADFYIPALSREMGDRWCSDQLSFAGVTIGVSRLQAMLRALGPHWSGDKAADPSAPAVLMIVPQEAHHTLGAIVLSGQLRRRGLSVRLMLGAKPKDVAKRICRTNYHGIFISSSQSETLETLRKIVDAVKTSTEDAPPIVVGGAILEVETVDNITALTGADYATRIPDEAIRLCGLTKPRSTAHKPSTGLKP